MLPKPYYQDAAVTIYCADARNILPLLPSASVDMVLTDPPYGVGVDYVSYKDSADSFAALLQFCLPQVLRISSKAVIWFGAAVTVARDLSLMLPLPDRILIWNVTFSLSHIMAHGMAYRWHPIYCWRLPKKHDGPQRDVLSFTTDGHHGWYHPGTKPLSLIRSLTGIALENGIILDPFAGSGTTGRAAKDMSRKAILIEIEEKYCEIAAQRMKQSVLPLVEHRSDETVSRRLF